MNLKFSIDELRIFDPVIIMFGVASYGQNQQTSQAAKESSNFVNEKKVNGKLARAPSADYSFMMNEENGQQPVELITKIDESISNLLNRTE